MTELIVQNNDCRIWYKEQFIIDLMMAMFRDEQISISLNIEGPCATSLGLYQLLDDVCARTQYDKTKIKIKTCNLKEHHSVYQIEIAAPHKHVDELQQRIIDKPRVPKQITKNTKTFGCFIGHANRARLAIASHLYTRHSEQTVQTYHFDPNNDYHREFASLNEMILNNYDWNKVKTAVDFLQHVPMTYDIKTYPIISRQHTLSQMFGIENLYQDFFVDISCQTYFTGNTFYLDEKIWRAVMNYTPFIVQGPTNFISNLQTLGFKTFDRWWDESYSQDPPDYQVDCVIKHIDQLAKLTESDIKQMYQEMLPVLEHNYRHFLSLKPVDYLKTYQ